MNKKIDIPTDLKTIMTLIIESGYECYLVGGAVRDNIIGIENKDYDLATNIPFDILKTIIPKVTVMKENSHRNTAIIRHHDYDYEFSSYRGNTLKEDLENRDFKINAIAADYHGNIIDYFNGVDDIKNQKISLVKPNGEGLITDPLRIMRAIRLSLKYDYTIDEITREQMLIKKELLNDVAAERIYSELKKILVSQNIKQMLLEYKEIFFQIIPELKTCDNFDQKNDYHIYDIYTHICNVVDNTKDNIENRLAALFHDIGKPSVFTIDDNQIGHFLGHAKESSKIFKEFALKYKLDTKTKKIVNELVLYHEDELSKKNNKIYNFYKKFSMNSVELLFDLKRSDVLSQNPKYNYRIEELNKLENKYKAIREKYKKIRFTGDDLIGFGYEGKEIGIILDDIKRQIINNRIKDNTDEIKIYLNKNYRKENSDE